MPAAVATFACPKDGETFTILWTFRREVTCPRCWTVWRTDVITGDNGDVTGARITEDTGRKELPTG